MRILKCQAEWKREHFGWVLPRHSAFVPPMGGSEVQVQSQLHGPIADRFGSLIDNFLV
jgi:hypothetical protein